MAPTDKAVISKFIAVCLVLVITFSVTAADCELKGNRNCEATGEIFNPLSIDRFNKEIQAMGDAAALKGISILFETIPFLWWGSLKKKVTTSKNLSHSYQNGFAEAVPIQNSEALDEFGLPCQVPDPIWRHNEKDKTGVTLEYFWLADNTIQLSRKIQTQIHADESGACKTEKEIDPRRCAFCNCRGHTIANCHKRKASKL